MNWKQAPSGLGARPSWGSSEQSYLSSAREGTGGGGAGIWPLRLPPREGESDEPGLTEETISRLVLELLTPRCPPGRTRGRSVDLCPCDPVKHGRMGIVIDKKYAFCAPTCCRCLCKAFLSLKPNTFVCHTRQIAFCYEHQHRIHFRG